MSNIQIVVIDSENIAQSEGRDGVEARLKQAKLKMEDYTYAGAAPDHASETGSDVSTRHQHFEETLYDEKLYPTPKIEEFYLQNITLNSYIRRQSKDAGLTLVSLPPSPGRGHPAHLCLKYLEILLKDVPRAMLVRGYRRDVMTIYQ